MLTSENLERLECSDGTDASGLAGSPSARAVASSMTGAVTPNRGGCSHVPAMSAPDAVGSKARGSKFASLARPMLLWPVVGAAAALFASRSRLLAQQNGTITIASSRGRPTPRPIPRPRMRLVSSGSDGGGYRSPRTTLLIKSYGCSPF